MSMTDVLAVPMGKNDADASTVGDYLVRLLLGVWEEGEAFDGKRPFGNSSWEGEICLALVQAGVLEGVVSTDGDLDECDFDAADALVADAIRSLYP